MTLAETTLIGGFLLGICSLGVIQTIRFLVAYIKFEYQYLKFPRVVEYSNFRACTGRHAWTEVTLALRGIDAGKYNICKKCGVISGNTEKMLSDEALEQVNQSLELIKQQSDFEAQITRRVQTALDSYVDQYLRHNFADEIRDTRTAARLKMLADYVVDAQNLAAEKVAAEINGQRELDERYEAWPSKVKGNA